MAAFLECLSALQEHARWLDASFSPPYRIEEDRIQDVSIKLQFNTYDKWTKALKFMLANLKVALQWMVKHKMAVVAPTLGNLGHEGPAL